MKADTLTMGAVETIIKKLTEAYKARNLNAVMECFASDDNVTLIGTGVDEKRVGLEQIRIQVERDWAQTESIEMSFFPKSISAVGSIAWAFADGAFNIRVDGQTMVLPARVSFVLENRGGQWLIVHAHFSTPTAGQEEGSSI